MEHKLKMHSVATDQHLNYTNHDDEESSLVPWCIFYSCVSVYRSCRCLWRLEHIEIWTSNRTSPNLTGHDGCSGDNTRAGRTFRFPKYTSNGGGAQKSNDSSLEEKG